MARGVIWATGAAALALVGCGSDDRSVDNADGAPSVGSAMAATPAAKTGPGSWKLPMKASAISATEFAAIMKAAGYKKTANTWVMIQENASCSNPILEDGPDTIRDLNSDGNPEVIVSDDSMQCNGASSYGFTIVTWSGTEWRNIGGGGFSFTGLNYPQFYPREGSAWPDMETGGAGSCYQRFKWSGTDYSGDAGWSIDNKKCTPPPEMMGDEPTPPKPITTASTKPSKLPIPVGYYAVNTSCADALKNRDGTTITETEYLDIVDRIPVKVSALGGDRYSLGPELFSMRVTGAEKFTTDDGMDYTWCAAKAPR